MERWNKIVQWREKVINADEVVIQRMWETLFSEVFHYSSIDGEIDSIRKINIGANNSVIPDIVISKEGEELFVVELKRCTVPFNEKIDTQIKSYMKQLQLSVGLLICSELHIYVNKDGEFKRFCIDFTLDNSDGRDFIEMFKKGSFSVEKVEKYIIKKTDKVKKTSEILNTLDSDYARDIIKNYFIGEDFEDDEIESALEELTITVEKKLNTCVSTEVRPKSVEVSSSVVATTTNKNQGEPIKELRTGDIIKARTHAEFLNTVFRKNYKQWMQSTWNYDSSIFVWMVRFDGGERGGWTNRLLSDNEIREECHSGITTFKGKPLDDGILKKRIVIDVVENGSARDYTFRGVFKYEEDKSNPYKVRYYKKISDTFSINWK